MSTLTYQARVANLNDQLRQGFKTNATAINGAFKIMMTPGIQELSARNLDSLLHQVATFDAFTEDNDPHSERDFGAIDQEGVRYFWKIVYYDRSLEAASPDAADPSVTTRVLTIMRADEY
jgi:hypothetical protein